MSKTNQIPVDPSDLVAAVRALLRGPDTSTDHPIDRTLLLEDICAAAAAAVTVVSTARTADRLREQQEQRTLFRDADLVALEKLAARLLDAGPHVLNEIENIEDEQAARGESEVGQ